MDRIGDEISKQDLLRILSDLKDHHNAMMRKIHWHRRENERLRAALEECAIADTAEAANRIAREALREVGDV